MPRMAPAAALRALSIGILVASPVAAFVTAPKMQRYSLRASVDERDASGETPLIKAAEAGDCDAVSSLLQQGADAMAESYTQWTALHGAAEAGCVACCRLLLGAGARPDARAKSGMTPAEIAKKYGRDAAFELLSQTPLDTYPVAVPETGGTIIHPPVSADRANVLFADRGCLITVLTQMSHKIGHIIMLLTNKSVLMMGLEILPTEITNT